MFLALNRSLRTQRRRPALIAAVLVMATSVAAAHGALADGHMSKGMAMCLAVADSALLAVGAALTVRPAGELTLGRWLPYAASLVWRPRAQPQPPARAGPAVLQVFRR